MREFVDPERGMTRRRPSPEARSYPQRMHHDGVALAKHLAAGGWSRRRLFGASLVASMAAACSPTLELRPATQTVSSNRVVRIAMPPTLDYVARVDRARDLQATRGEALREGVGVEVVPVGLGPFSHEPPEQDRMATARRTLAAGQRIDVVWTPFVDLGDLHRDRQITPIAAYAAKDHLDLKAYSPQALKPAFAPDRGLMALPSEVDARQVYFRTDHLAEAGVDFRRAGLDFERPSVTWNSFRRVIVDAHASPAGRNRFTFDPMSEALPAAAWAWQAGLPVARPTAQGLEPLTDSLGWLASLAQEINLGPTRKVPNRSLAVRFGSIGPPMEGAAVGRDDVSRHLLLSGSSSIAIDNTRLVSTIAAHDASLPIRVVELPRRTSGSANVGWSDVSGYALMTGSSDDAWHLLKYMAGEDAAYASARAVAMRHMADRTGAEDISSLVALLVQSERFGASIVDARAIAIMDTMLESPLGQLAMIPMLAWIAKNAPEQLKATFFAVMASFANLALAASSLGTKYLNEVFIVTREVRDRATGAVLVSSDYSLVGWLLITAALLAATLPLLTVAAVQASPLQIGRAHV